MVFIICLGIFSLVFVCYVSYCFIVFSLILNPRVINLLQWKNHKPYKLVHSEKSPMVLPLASIKIYPEQGFQVIEVNSSDWRNGALVKQKIGEAVRLQCSMPSFENPDNKSQLKSTPTK
ncbi:hypothetical protein L1987_74230 [Smallanthus sonchifolius]|uniref:Uncharacterized protein n=1 Tax=Smallanthus sonchifolius TaxID=185202 RepID=A0ACB9A333_9ASTR|nr:hypothetical protein L1987_74230 [Smallanthus sonchifolius]